MHVWLFTPSRRYLGAMDPWSWLAALSPFLNFYASTSYSWHESCAKRVGNLSGRALPLTSQPRVNDPQGLLSEQPPFGKS